MSFVYPPDDLVSAFYKASNEKTTGVPDFEKLISIVSAYPQPEAWTTFFECSGIFNFGSHDSPGVFKFLECLLNIGVSINFSDIDRTTMMRDAAHTGNTKMVEFLLDHGAYIHVIDSNNKGALYYALLQNKDEPVRLLLEKGACLRTEDKNLLETLKNRFFKWCHEGHYENIAAILKPYPDCVHWEDQHCETGLFRSIDTHKDVSDIVRLLVDKGANVNFRNKVSVTPLLWAAALGNLNNIAALLDAGADINAVDNNGNTALFWAAPLKQQEAFQLLLDRGIDFAVKNNQGSTVEMNARGGLYQACYADMIFKKTLEVFHTGLPKDIKALKPAVITKKPKGIGR